MPEARDLYGTVFQHGSAVLLARIVFANGQTIVRADLASARYTIFELDPCSEGTGQAVTGHEDVALVVSEVLYDTLQTGDPWTVDAEGYNFRHEIEVGSSEGFPQAGRDYQVRYELQPITGQRVVLRFQLRAI